MELKYFIRLARKLSSFYKPYVSNQVVDQIKHLIGNVTDKVLNCRKSFTKKLFES